MPRRDAERTGQRSVLEPTVQQSIIERLTGSSAASTSEPTWAVSVKQLKTALRRDLEWLLNTRRIVRPAPAGCDELRESLYYYGLPDVTTIGRDVPDAQFRLAQEVEAAIAQFEPRLVGARVSFTQGADATDRRLHFVIDALLRMDPTPERVVFDTMLDPTRGEFEVRTNGERN